jgi:general stress protein 26
MMNDDNIKQAQMQLMATAENCYLTTINSDGYPYTRSMFNLRNREQYPAQAKFIEGLDDEFIVYFGTNTSAVKIKQIKANPAVSVYYCNPKEIHGLMLSGDIEIDTDPEMGVKIWQEGWERYYPQGPTDPDYTVLRLKPVLVRGWYQGKPFEYKLN